MPHFLRSDFIVFSRSCSTTALIQMRVGQPVAKGIETAEEEALVRSQKITLVQGFHYGHPLSVTDVPEFVRSRGMAPPAISAFSI